VKKIPEIETDRLILRPFRKEDAAEVMRLAGDRAIADTTLSIPHPYEEGMAEEWISKHRYAFDKNKEVTFAATRRSDGALLGAISLMGMTKRHQAELGYWVGKPYWNNGYCTEAARAVVNYAFSDLGLIRVYSCHLRRNPPSGRVLQKIGMTHEGCLRQHVRKWNKLEDLDLYGILEDEWNEADKAMNRDEG
jgi:RimJ/RimL family protein N-acetyltransferase